MKKNKTGFIVVAVVIVIGIIFIFARMGTASSRAEALVRDYLEQHILGFESVSFPSVLTGEYVRDGYLMIGTATIEGKDITIIAEVEMNGIFDSGRILSIRLGDKEIYR